VRIIGVFLGLVLLLAIAAVPGYAYYQTLVQPNLELVVQVNDVKFTMGDYVKLLRIYRLGQDASGGGLDLSTAPFQLLKVMEDNELIVQAGPRLGLEVTDQEVQREIERRVVPPEKEGEEVDPVTLAREFNERYRQRLNSLGLNDKEYRRTVRYDLMRGKLRERLGVQVPTVTRQIHLYGIPLDSQEKAEELKKKLGKLERSKVLESFKDFARESSTDPDLAQKKGNLGWIPKDVRPEFDEILFGLAENNVSFPIKTPEGHFLLKVLDKTDTQASLKAILFETDDKAYEARQRWARGDDFDVLSDEFNTDPGLKRNKGSLGTISRGYKNGLFDQVIFGLMPGDVAGPIVTAERTWLLTIAAIEPAKEISEENRDILKNRVLDRWLLDERRANQVQRRFDSERYEWVIEQLRVQHRPTPQAGSGTRQ